jgi:hypothetical protein
MSKSIPGRDHSFIKYITITDISKNDFLLNTVTIDNLKQKKVIPHSDFLIDKDKTKKFIIDVVSEAMKKLKRSSIIAEFDDDEVDYRRKASGSRKKTRSRKSNNSFLNMNKNAKSKNKSNSNTKSKINLASIFKITNAKKTKSHTKKSHSKKNNNPVRKERLSEFLSPYEKYQRNERRKVENLEKMQKQAGMQKGFEDKKGMILGGPQTGITPLQGVVPAGPAQQAQELDPLDAKCKSIGSDESSCKSTQGCYFTPYNQCIKSKFQNPRPAYGNPPPTLGANPTQNLFTIPQQQPQALF